MEPAIEYIMKCIFIGLSQVCDEVHFNVFACFGQYYAFLVPHICFFEDPIHPFYLKIPYTFFWGRPNTSLFYEAYN